MMDTNDKTNNIISKTIIVLLIIVTFIIVVAVSIAALYFINKNNTKSTNTSQNSTKVISNLSNKITALPSKLYQQQPTPSATVIYKLDGRSYSVETPTNNSLMFPAISSSQPDNNSKVQTQTAVYMKGKGLNVDNFKPDSVDSTTVTTYSNDTTVCQLTDYQPPSNSGGLQNHTISCVDKSAITDEYGAVEKLFAIYTKTNKLPSFTQASRYTHTEGNKSYSKIRLNTKTARTRLLFASVDGNWEYIGNLSSGEPQYTGSQYTITPATRSKINNPKYGNFLTNVFY